MIQGINFAECTSQQYEGKGSKLEYSVQDAMPDYSPRAYMQRTKQNYRQKYYQGD